MNLILELDKDEEKDNDEENDGFFVPHGYLSSDEEQNDNGESYGMTHTKFEFNLYLEPLIF